MYCLESSIKLKVKILCLFFVDLDMNNVIRPFQSFQINLERLFGMSFELNSFGHKNQIKINYRKDVPFRK